MRYTPNLNKSNVYKIIIRDDARAEVSVASSAVFPQNWASFDEALWEKFSSRGLWFFGLFLANTFRYSGLVFGVTTSVRVQDNCM